MASANKEALWTPAFVLMCISNFLLFFSFYQLLPVLPAYLLDEFHASPSVSGLILAIYTLSALIIRPFSGFIADSVVRKPLHVVCLLIFISLFAGYLFATTLLLIALLRAVHGMAFGMVTVSGSTLAIDIMPSSRRGEGLAFFGVTSSLAMATGPMSGLFLLKHYSYNTNFLTALASGLAAWLFVLFVRAKPHPRHHHQAISLDRFFLLKGTHGAIGLMMMASLYGALLSYVALFAREVGLADEAGYFFVTLAFGVALSRLGSGKLIDRGRMVELIVAGKVILVASTALFALFPNPWIFLASSVLMGVGCGLIGPCYQNLFINLAEHSQRGTANSTFFTAWDMGIGFGTLVGGLVAQRASYQAIFLCGVLLVACSLAYFLRFTARHYHANKLDRTA